MGNQKKDANPNLQKAVIWFFRQLIQNECKHAFSRIEVLSKAAKQDYK